MRRRRRVAVTTLSLLVGTALVSSLLAVALDVEEKVGRELRSFGANIILTPRAESVPVEIGGMPVGEAGRKSYLSEADLPRLKTIFWKNNITAFAPFVYGTVSVSGEKIPLAGTWFDREVPLENGDVFRTGVGETSPWWQVEGSWPTGPGQVLVGREQAERLGLSPGDRASFTAGGRRADFTVAGIVTTGGPEDGQVFTELGEAQALLGLPGKVEKVQVSALTKPPDELAHRARALEDPRELPGDEYDIWYCSPYVDSITFQIEEAFPGAGARPVRQVAEAEGAFMDKMRWLFVLIAAVATSTSALGVTATMSATVMERRPEIGLMKALGAENSQVAAQFFLEAAFCGLVAGMAGYGLGIGLAAIIGKSVFGAPSPPGLVILPVAVFVSLAMALTGSAIPVRRATGIRPIEALRA